MRTQHDLPFDEKIRATEIHRTLCAVKEDFRQYLKKYPFTYKNAELTTTEIQKRSDFLDETKDNFEKFYQTLIEVLIKIKPEDIQTIASENESAHFKHFTDCYHSLDLEGFYSVNGKPIQFWSGQVAKNKIIADQSQYSDSDIPAISVMYKLNHFIQAEEKRRGSFFLKRLLAELNTAYFASQAKGIVNIYLATNKEKEKSGITIGNYFWNEELPILQKKYFRNEIQLRLFLWKGGDYWEGPYDIYKQSHLVPVVRRNAYRCFSSPRLLDHSPERFETEEKMIPEQKPFLTWSKQPARPQVLTLSNLKKITQLWRIHCPKAFRFRFFAGFLPLLKSTNNQSIPLMSVHAIVNFLIQSNISVDIRDEHRATPLIYAALIDDTKIIAALLEAKADINAKNYRGDTALMTAAYEGNIASIQLLLESKADIQATDNYGFSALMWAMKQCRDHTVSLLLKSRANPFIVNKCGKNIYSYALECKSMFFKQMVEKAMDEELILLINNLSRYR